MNFNETLVYIIFFIFIFNFLDYIRLRWKAVRLHGKMNESWFFLHKYFVLISVLTFVVLLVLISCYASYVGLREAYSKNMAILGGIIFYFGGGVLFWSAYRSLKELFIVRGDVEHKENKSTDSEH